MHRAADRLFPSKARLQPCIIASIAGAFSFLFSPCFSKELAPTQHQPRATARFKDGIELTVRRFKGTDFAFYVSGSRGKIVGTPDWNQVSLGQNTVVYSMSTKKYKVYSPSTRAVWHEDPATRDIRDQIAAENKLWSSWERVGSDMLFGTIKSTKWQRKRTAALTGAPGGGIEEVLSTEDFPIEPVMRKAFCLLCLCDPPRGLPLKCTYTRTSPSGTKQVEKVSYVTRVQPVKVAGSEFALPKGLKQVDDLWEVVSIPSLDDTLFMTPIKK